MRISLGLSLAVGAWILGHLGLFEAIDGIVYDAFMRMRAGVDRSPPQVLLLEIDDPSYLTEEDWLVDLILTVESMNPKQIVLNFLPPDDFHEFYKMAEENVGIVLGRRLLADPLEPDKFVASPKSAALERYDLRSRVGVVRQPVAVAGVCRASFSRVKVGPKDHRTLEVVAAHLLLETDLDLSGSSYLIDFEGGPGSLPNLTVSRALDGDLIRENVEGKSVLVGRKSSQDEPGVHTPTTVGAETMTVLEYQGQALNTLLSGRVLTSLSSAARFLLLVTLALLLSIVYQYLSLQIFTWVTAVVLLGYCGMIAVAFVYLDTWWPLTEIVLFQGCLYIITVRHRALQITKATQHLIADSSNHMRDKYWPAHLEDSSPSWSLIAHMIDQTLDLNKLIFLEADLQSSRLREILALHCSFEDIVENRRDCSRSPYTDSLAASGPLKVKDFMTTSTDEEQQFLSPLVFCGELLGFWAIGIEAAKAAEIPRFKVLLTDYTRRMSELLFHSRRHEESGSTEPVSKAGLAGETFEATFRSLQSTLGLLQYRLSTLEVLLNQLESGVIVYDIFGRVLQINEVMLTILNKENLAPYEMTALDLILSLSDYDISKSRKILRRVVVENHSVSFPVALRSNPSGRCLLHLKPLQGGARGESRGVVDRLGAKSILCEIVDTTSVTQLSDLKSQLTSRLGVQIRDDLATVEMASSILAIDAPPGSRSREIADILHSKVQKTVHTLTECRHYLDQNSGLDGMERFPVNPRPLLLEAVERIRIQAAQEGLEIEIREPTFVSYVLASADKLRQLLLSILGLLCQDAADNTTVLVRVTEDVDIVAFDFSNMGFGIPNELLHEYLYGGEAALASAELQNLQAAVRWIEAWGGHLEAVSGVGIWMHFTLHLAKFI